jgi:hypothetical protein
MKLLRLDPNETEGVTRGREAFRLLSLGCEGYTTGVCAALLCIVSEYSGKTPHEIGELKGEQLWTLARAGFIKTINIPKLPKSVFDYLCLGEKAAIKVGMWTLRETIPTGTTLDGICESCGFDYSILVGLIDDENKLTWDTSP